MKTLYILHFQYPEKMTDLSPSAIDFYITFLFIGTNKKQYSNNPKLEVYEIPYKSY